MIGVSTAYQILVQTSHQHTARIDVVQNGVVVASLNAHDGSVTADRNNSIMRRFDCKVTDPTGALTPAGIRDLLAPFGTIVNIYLGLLIPTLLQAVRADQTTMDWSAGTLFQTIASGNTLILT